MPYHFETENIEPNNKEYTEGGAAAVNNKPRKSPFENEDTPEAHAWYLGYDDIIRIKEKK